MKKNTPKPKPKAVTIPHKKTAGKNPPAEKAKISVKKSPHPQKKAAVKGTPHKVVKAPAKLPAKPVKKTPPPASAKKPVPPAKDKKISKPEHKKPAAAPAKKPVPAAHKPPAHAAPAQARHTSKPAQQARPQTQHPPHKKPVPKAPPPKKSVPAKDKKPSKPEHKKPVPDAKKQIIRLKKKKVVKPPPPPPRKPKPTPRPKDGQEDFGSLSKSDTMKVYMQDIGQISLVTKEEEVILAAKIHGNDPKAKEEARTTLIKANLRLVVKIAHDFKGLGLPLLDLISEGNIGLMRAVEKFDPAKGAKFSSYAAWWIKQSMRRALANQSKTIRIPVQSAGKINKIKSARLKLSEKLSREPTDAEIADYLEFSERTVAGLRLADLRTFSLHDPIQQGEDGEFQDIIPDQSASIPDRMLGDIESVARLTNLLTSLDDRERMILKMRFGLDGSRPRTLEEVSQEIGRTRERVRQIQNQTLSKLKGMLADESGFVAD